MIVFFAEKLGIPLIDYPRATKLIVLERSDYVDQNQEAYQLETYGCANLVSIKGYCLKLYNVILRKIPAMYRYETYWWWCYGVVLYMCILSLSKHFNEKVILTVSTFDTLALNSIPQKDRFKS